MWTAPEYGDSKLVKAEFGWHEPVEFRVPPGWSVQERGALRSDAGATGFYLLEVRDEPLPNSYRRATPYVNVMAGDWEGYYTYINGVATFSLRKGPDDLEIIVHLTSKDDGWAEAKRFAKYVAFSIRSTTVKRNWEVRMIDPSVRKNGVETEGLLYDPHEKELIVGRDARPYLENGFSESELEKHAAATGSKTDRTLKKAPWPLYVVVLLVKRTPEALKRLSAAGLKVFFEREDSLMVAGSIEFNKLKNLAQLQSVKWVEALSYHKRWD